jgi:hypothetical protein
MDASGGELMLSIAGLVGHVALATADRAFLEQVHARYGAFAMPVSPSVGRDVSLRLTFSASASTSARLSKLDRILRLAWSKLLAGHGGLLVGSHASAAQETGVLFPSASGAGAEQVVAIRREAGGTGWRVHGTPFSEGDAGDGVSMRSRPLRAIAFVTPSQNGGVTAAPLTSAEAARRLRGCLSAAAPPEDAPSERDRALAAALCSEVRCVDAAVAPEASVLELGPRLGFAEEAESPPANKREMIAELRSRLRAHSSYAFRPTGGSMRPWLKSGDALFIKRTEESDLATGDVLLYWTPGRRPQDDVLICHRMIARVPALHGPATYVTKGDALSNVETFENRRQSEILGKVAAISRDGKTWPAPGRVGNLARLFGSLALMPLLKIAGH